MTLIIIEDHPMMSIGLKTFIESNSQWKVQEIFSTSQDALDYLERLSNPAENSDKIPLPDIALFDIYLKDNLSFPAIKTVTQKFRSIKVVANSMYDTDGFQVMAKNCGAKGYVSKADPPEKLIECLDKVQRGEEVFNIEMTEKLEKISQIYQIMTKQEKKVFALLLVGKSNQEISKSLSLKTHTVENYINRIYEKLGVHFREDILQKFK